MKKFFALGLALLLAGTSFSQDAKEIIQKVADLYSAKNSIEYELSYTFYEDVKAVKPYSSTTSVVKSSGGMYYIKTPESFTLQNSKYLVMIDHSRKLVMLDKVNVTSSKKKNATPVFSVDSMMKACQSTELKTEGNFYILTMKMKQENPGKIDRAVIKLRKSDCRIEQVTMFYQQILNEDNGKMIRPWVSISYRNFRVNNAEISKYFDESSIFSITKGGAVTLSAEYKKYNLLSHL